MESPLTSHQADSGLCGPGVGPGGHHCWQMGVTGKLGWPNADHACIPLRFLHCTNQPESPLHLHFGACQMTEECVGNLTLFICLAALGLSCGTRDLSLQYIDSLVAMCGLSR